MKNQELKELVIEMVKKLNNADEKFLIQLYTIIKKHFDKERGR